MKSIKDKIIRPYIMIIAILPLITLLLFNLSMNLYLVRTSKQDLRSTVSSMNLLIRNQLIGHSLKGYSTEEVETLLTTLSSALKASRLSSQTDFILFDKEDNLLFPRSITSPTTKVPSKLIEGVQEVAPSLAPNTISTLKVGLNRYYIIRTQLFKNSSLTSPYVVFVTSVNSAQGIMSTVNLMLICIFIVSGCLSLYLALRTSKSISKPINHLYHYTEQIGQGDFIALPEDTSSIEIHALYKNIHQMSMRLRQYDTTQKSFLQHASHELRTPLMSIQGYAEGLSKGVFNDVPTTANIILKESQRLSALVESLLTLSRIETAPTQQAFTTFLLSDLLKETLQKIHGLAIKKNIQVHCLFSDLPLKVSIDEQLFSQAVLNILSNGIRYAKSTLSVTTEATSTHALIAISNDGPPLDKEALPHLFERFYKGEDGNLGLGLAIASSAVSQLNGWMKAYNNEKNHAVFEIGLPLIDIPPSL